MTTMKGPLNRNPLLKLDGATITKSIENRCLVIQLDEEQNFQWQTCVKALMQKIANMSQRQQKHIWKQSRIT